MKSILPGMYFLKHITGKIKCKVSLAFLLLCFLSYGALAQNAANIIVGPASTLTAVGQSFTVNVKVDFTTPPASSSVDAVEVHLTFDKTKLSVASITKPASGILPNEAIPLQPIGTINANGQINYAAFTLSSFPNADFDLLAITFNVIGGTGTTTPLTYLTVFPNRTDAQRNGSSIVGSIVNGSATIQNCTPPTATLAAASGCGGQPTSVNLATATGVSPFDLVINGTTYNDITVSTTPFATIPFPVHKVWPANPTPANPYTQDDGPAIHAGMKFRSSQAGFIKGIRFYAGDQVSGTFKGKLWRYDPPSALLQTATFTVVTANGWNEVLFPTPVAIAANATYVATYYSSEGQYVADENFFTSPVTSGPLTAIGSSSPTSEINGIYFLGTEAAANATMDAGGFGNWASYNRSNYWVDVIFVPNVNTITLTSITDANGCNITGTLQTINVFSPDCSTLPVTLTNLSATPQGNKITVRWTTSSELNSLGFDVQRSTDGVNWTSIGFVQGAGNSSTVKSYSYVDNNLEPRKYYYKLKHIDNDQRFKYSSIVSATLNGKAEFVLGQNYPNPFTDQTTIQFTVPATIKVNISLFDMNGRVLKTLVNGSKDAGSHVINVNIGALSKGVYYYKMQAGDFTDVKKLVIQ